MSNQIKITEQEIRAIEFLKEGHLQEDIATKMFMSRTSFTNFLYHLRQKLGVSTTVQLIVMAYENGWIKINGRIFSDVDKS